MCYFIVLDEAEVPFQVELYVTLNAVTSSSGMYTFGKRITVAPNIGASRRILPRPYV